eukprot:TRINITY_DN10810_c0_g1_i2.p4 TRINITY_DN10810_c0_g1~~TRINITY_DN10810_c0_g1_i2.p4  ORF type:complete len:120 (-),score=1.91 TRINITY_DN10810_c0_g1_i2:767-1126(-)
MIFPAQLSNFALIFYYMHVMQLNIFCYVGFVQFVARQVGLKIFGQDYYWDIYWLVRTDRSCKQRLGCSIQLSETPNRFTAFSTSKSFCASNNFLKCFQTFDQLFGNSTPLWQEKGVKRV